jgi:hypothetical protein
MLHETTNNDAAVRTRTERASRMVLCMSESPFESLDSLNASAAPFVSPFRKWLTWWTSRRLHRALIGANRRVGQS